jgi:hypothetical protein
MRDRHLRQILNRVRHHKNEEAAAVKMRTKIFCIMASRLFAGGRLTINKRLRDNSRRILLWMD